MKWDRPNGSVQHTADKRYCVVQATEENWIGYELTPFGTSVDLGTGSTDERARALCEQHENMLVGHSRMIA
jgi:hypothetical protein